MVIKPLAIFTASFWSTSALVLSGCAPSVQSIVYEENRPAKPFGCELDVYREGEQIGRQTEILGDIAIGDTGFSVSCGADEVMGLIRDNACQVGADAVYIHDIHTPDIISTCWRASATFFAYVGAAVAPPADLDSSQPTASGTCFAVRDDGHILTSYHVVSDFSLIEVIFPDGVARSAQISRVDPANDLALLQVQSPTPAYLSLESEPDVGQQVFTIGFPAIEIMGPEAKFTEGSISALSGVQGAANLLQHSVPTQPGNSGGPLVNLDGQVVGIVTSSAAVQAFYSETGTIPQNVNWAVKAAYAVPLFPSPEPVHSIDRSSAIELAQQALCRVEAR